VAAVFHDFWVQNQCGVALRGPIVNA
jgi:hypothetical protein